MRATKWMFDTLLKSAAISTLARVLTFGDDIPAKRRAQVVGSRAYRAAQPRGRQWGRRRHWTGAELRALRAERGVGRPPRVLAARNRTP